MRNAARRNETANYTLKVKVADEIKPEAEPPQPSPTTRTTFDKNLELQGIRFHVTSENKGSVNNVRIVTSGLATDNSPVEQKIDGTGSNAEVADNNADGSPEIYVYVTSAGSGSYGSLVAYSANQRKSLSQIYLPPWTQSKKLSKAYMGHDEFAVVEGLLVRRFPV